MNNALRLGKQSLTIAVVVATILWSVGVALLPLQAEGASLAAGDLIKRPDLTAVYYYGEDAKRHPFASQEVYASWYGNDFSSVKTITIAEMNEISLGRNATFRPGSRLVKITTDPKVYAVEKNGSLRWVETAAVAAALYGSDWEAKLLVDLPDALFTADYNTSGASIKAAADHDKVAAMNASPSISVDKGLGSAAPAAPATPAATPAAGDKVTLTRLAVTRSGLSTDNRVTAVRLWDGTTQVGTSQTLNSAHQAVFTGLAVDLGVAEAGGKMPVALASDSPAAASVTYNAANAVALKLKFGSASKTLTVSFDVAAAGAGEVIIFSLASAADATLSGATVSGTFPLNGAGMSISAVVIGTAAISAGPSMPTSDTNVRPDESGRQVAQWRVTIGSTEGASLRQLSLLRTGTVADGAIKLVTLKNDSKGEVLGTGKFANNKITFPLNLPVLKGDNVLLGAYLDMEQSIASSNQTVGVEIHDGVSYLLQVVGATYGFGITPTRTDGCTTTGITGGACQTQTVSAPTLRVERAPESPATGNIAAGKTGTAFAAFNYVVTGGAVTVTQMRLIVTPAAGSSASDLTNIVFVDKDGNVVAGPKDGSTATINTAETLTYTDTISFPVGTTTLWAKANVAIGAMNNETYVLSMPAPSTNFVAREVLSGKVVTPTTAAAVAGQTQTVKGATFSAITDLAPIAGTIVANTQGFTFVILKLDSTAGGEGTKVASVTATDTLGAGAALTDLINLELWGDPDNTDADNTLVRLETSNSTATNAATTTFTFRTPLHVSNTAFSTFYLKATVIAAASTGATATHTFNFTAAVATGWSTGADITETFSGTGQAQTIQASGNLKVELASDTAPAAQLVAGSTGVPAVKYKFTAGREAVDVTEIPIVAAGTATASYILAVKLKLDGTLIGSTNGYSLNNIGYVMVTLSSGTFTLQKDVARYLTIEVDLHAKAQLTSGRTVRLGIADSAAATPLNAEYFSEWGAAGNYNITATGTQSGVAITKANIDNVNDGTGTVAGGNTSTAYDGVIVVSLNASSPSGVQTAGTGKEVLRLDFTATGDEITVHDAEIVPSGVGTITGTGAATLKSSDGSVTYVTWAAGTAWLAQANFHVNGSVAAARAAGATTAAAWTTTLSIAAGQTKTLKLEGDTTGKTTNNTASFSLAAGQLVSGLQWYDVELTSANVVDSALTKNLPVNGNGLSY